VSRRVWADEDDQPYYELVCDTCRQPFHSFDDSCYDWRLLCDAAAEAGWDAEPAGPHRCVGCQHERPSPAAA
jgi:hypothetical protein